MAILKEKTEKIKIKRPVPDRKKFIKALQSIADSCQQFYQGKLVVTVAYRRVYDVLENPRYDEPYYYIAEKSYWFHKFKPKRKPGTFHSTFICALFSEKLLKKVRSTVLVGAFLRPDFTCNVFDARCYDAVKAILEKYIANDSGIKKSEIVKVIESTSEKDF